MTDPNLTPAPKFKQGDLVRLSDDFFKMVMMVIDVVPWGESPIYKCFWYSQLSEMQICNFPEVCLRREVTHIQRPMFKQ